MRKYSICMLAATTIAMAIDAKAQDSSVQKYRVITPKDDLISAVDINSKGEIVGTEWIENKKDSSIIEESPFVAKGSSMTFLPLLEGYTATFPAAISDDGLVVGRASKPGSLTKRIMLRNQAFIWNANEGMRGLGAIKGDFASIATGVTRDGSMISGYSVGDNGMTPCVWQKVEGKWTARSLPKTVRIISNVVAISDDGRYIAAADGPVPCLWSKSPQGEWLREQIGDPGSLIPRAVNNHGTVVGFIYAGGLKHAVLRTKEAGCQRIEEPKGFVQSEALDINNDGVIVGTIEKEVAKNKELEPHAFVIIKGQLQLIEGGGPNFISANSINDRWEITGTFERDDEEIK